MGIVFIGDVCVCMNPPCLDVYGDEYRIEHHLADRKRRQVNIAGHDVTPTTTVTRATKSVKRSRKWERTCWYDTPYVSDSFNSNCFYTASNISHSHFFLDIFIRNSLPAPSYFIPPPPRPIFLPRAPPYKLRPGIFCQKNV